MDTRTRDEKHIKVVPKLCSQVQNGSSGDRHSGISDTIKCGRRSLLPNQYHGPSAKMIMRHVYCFIERGVAFIKGGRSIMMTIKHEIKRYERDKTS